MHHGQVSAKCQKCGSSRGSVFIFIEQGDDVASYCPFCLVRDEQARSQVKERLVSMGYRFNEKKMSIEK